MSISWGRNRSWVNVIPQPDAVSRLIADGTYARAVASITAEDPDLQDS